MKYAYLAFALLVIVACAPALEPVSELSDRVPDVAGEILYYDVFSDRIPSDNISFFGVRLGDSEERVVELHGEADSVSEYQFGAVRNLEYGFGQENVTVVLYHVERGVVRAVLVTNDANDLLVGETVMMGGRDRLYGLLGIPSVAQDLHMERAFVYNSLGYAVFINAAGIDRVYFSEPIRSDEELCAQVITPAVNAQGVCVEFRTPCDVPSGWEVVESCEGFESFDDEEASSNEPPSEDTVESESHEETSNRAPTITI